MTTNLTVEAGRILDLSASLSSEDFSISDEKFGLIKHGYKYKVKTKGIYSPYGGFFGYKVKLD